MYDKNNPQCNWFSATSGCVQYYVSLSAQNVGSVAKSYVFLREVDDSSL